MLTNAKAKETVNKYNVFFLLSECFWVTLKRYNNIVEKSKQVVEINWINQELKEILLASQKKNFV